MCFNCGSPVGAPEVTAATDGYRPPTEVAPDAPNLLDGQWLLLEKLASGGMGTVYVARDLKLDRKVAVKVLHAKVSHDAQYVMRFEREAKIMSSVDHPNVVTLFAVGRHKDQPYLVMKLLDGARLSELLAPRLPPKQAAPLFQQLCSALGALHEAGIIHRDIKPSNIIVSKHGHLTLLDLGIARTVGSTLTRTGVMWGTPEYMAPEQIAGNKDVDARADVYSAAALLFEMLTGRLPFEADDEHSLLLQHLRRAPPDASTLANDVPKELGRVISRALSKRPAERHSSARALYDDFARALGLPETGPGVVIQPSAMEDSPTEPRDTPKGEPFFGESSTPEWRPALVDAPPPPTSPGPMALGTEEPGPTRLQRSGAPALGDEGPDDTRNHPEARPGYGPPKWLVGLGLLAFMVVSGRVMWGVLAEAEEKPQPVMIEGKAPPPEKKVVPPPEKKAELTEHLPDRIRPATQEEHAVVQKDGTVVLRGTTKVGAQSSIIQQAAESPFRVEEVKRPPAAKLLKKPKPGQLRVTTTFEGQPVAATLYMNGRHRGKTPLYLTVRPGEHELKFLFGERAPLEMDIFLVEITEGHDLQQELSPDWAQQLNE